MILVYLSDPSEKSIYFKELNLSLGLKNWKIMKGICMVCQRPAGPVQQVLKIAAGPVQGNREPPGKYVN